MPHEALALDGDFLLNPTIFDLSVVECHMLWPDDLQARSLATRATTAEFGRRALPHMPDHLMRDIVPALVAAPPIGQAQAAAGKPFFEGYVAGMILHHVVGAVATDGDDASMGWIMSKIANDVRPRRLSKKTIENTLWPKYRRVSHFWAAYVERSYSETVFPCRLEKLAEFLSLAEAFRVAGEATRTKQSPRPTVLLPHECVTLPVGVFLPPCALQFSQKAG